MYYNMNPQYMSQYGVPTQNFPNKPPPSLTPQGFQNVPLGQQKPVSLTSNINDGPDSFGLTATANHNLLPAVSQFGVPQTLTQTNMLPQQNMRPPDMPLNNQNYIPTEQVPLPKQEISVNQFTSTKQDNISRESLNQNGLPPLTNSMSNSNADSYKFGQIPNNMPPTSQYNQSQKSLMNLPPSNEANQMPPGVLGQSKISSQMQSNIIANNDFNAAQFPRPPGIGQPPLQMPVNVSTNNDFNATQFSHPPLGGQPHSTALPPLTGQIPLIGQTHIQGQPLTSRPPLLSGPPTTQFTQQLPKGPYPPSNQFMPANNFSNQMQNMNISGSRQYVTDNGMHMPPPAAGKQTFTARSGQMPGYPPMPGQLPPSAHSDVSRMSGGGMPPLPGQQTMPSPLSGVSGPYPQQYQQQQQPKRLDPDQMPSPIQVMQDDQHTRSGIFCTNQKGLVPPLITTNFEVQDQGNASPRFIRSTMYNIPITQDLMKQTSVPFGLIISPMARTIDAEYPPPIVNFGDLGPVRCIRCKAYMSPYMQFIDAGRRFQCLFCKATTDVPAEYFQHLDHTGQRADRFERPELILGTYEFTATADYCRNNKFPKPPAFIFVIDVSYNNVKSGLVHLLCSQMKEIIKNLPIDQDQEKSNMKVGFITYNTTVHFYNIKGSLAAPQMLVVSDVQDMFMPLLDGFLCTPEESDIVIDALMQQIPTMFADTRETETILLPAILAGLEALKASECTGKLLVFHSTLPIAEAPGKLKNRDDRKLLGTDKERTVLAPQTQAYNQLGQDCVAFGCAVDLFLFNNSYIDIATIGQVSRLTGGEMFKYTYFQADVDGHRLISDVITDISRPIAFDTVMRVRTSTGIRATDFYGHFYMSNTTDIEIAAIDCDKAVAVEIKHDDKLTEEDGVYIQVALLYTSCSGQRRLRIMNLSLKTCSQMADLYRCCELDTIINFFGKQSMYRLLEHNPKNVKESIVARAAQMLANYRKNCASPSSAGQLILPECMKLLPLYVNCLLKSDAMSGGSDITIDDRSFTMHSVMTMDIPTSVSYFYPRLIPLADIKPTPDGKIEIPAPIRTSIEKTNDEGAYILENGIHMFFYIGLALNPEFCKQVFGVPTAVQIDIDKCELPVLDNPLSITIRSIINEIRVQRHRCMRLTFVRQREKLEPVFKHFLVEDRGLDGSPSYVDFLCHMHKEIRTILS